MKSKISIQESCKACGLCVEICPLRVLRLVSTDGNVTIAEPRPDRINACMACGQCMAICSTKSFHIGELTYDQFNDLPAIDITGSSFLDMITSRRSVRIFKDKSVPEEVLQKIIDASATAPMAYTPSKVEITIIQNCKAIEQAIPIIVELYKSLIRRMSYPFIRFMIRRRMLKPEVFTSLTEHVLPSLKNRLPEMRSSGDDTITWGVPAMLLFHAHRESGYHTPDIYIALTYALLTAHALSLGATAISLISSAVERVPELRKMYQIPHENEVVACMILGYTRYKFKRAIRRDFAKATWI